MKSKTKKRLAGSIALVSVLALLLSGTYAWQDFRQHSTNVFEAIDKPDVRLNDEYKPPEHWNTTLDALVDKKVSVSNTQNSSAPVFVRLRFSEYMETFDVDYSVFIEDAGVPVLFATYASGANIGEYLKWDTQQDAMDGLAAMGLNLVPYAVDDDADPIGTPDKWFARTQNAELQNGVYGKPMNDPASIQKSTPLELYGGVPKQALVQDVHDQTDPDITPYKVHTWDGKSITYDTVDPSFYVDENDAGKPSIAHFIQWDLGTQVMKMSQWVADGKHATDQWVLADDGWCYWATYLPPSTTTANIMEAVQLIKMPGNAFDYEIHIDMQAVTAEELEKTGADEVWTQMSADMRKALVDTVPAMTKRSELQSIIDYLKTLTKDDYTTGTWNSMYNELENAELLLANPNPTYDDLNNQIVALKAEKDGLIKRANKDNLNSIIAQLNAKSSADYTPASWDPVRVALLEAAPIVANKDASQAQVDTAYNKLLTAKNGLVPVSDKAGLNGAIAEAYTFIESDWSAATWTPFKTALLNAVTIRDNSSSTPQQIMDAWNALTTAQNNLRSDKTALDAKIAEVEALQGGANPALWNNVSVVLAEARDLSALSSAKQSEVDAMVDTLNIKSVGLRPIGYLLAMRNGEKYRLLQIDAATGKAMLISENIMKTMQMNTTLVYVPWGPTNQVRNSINESTFLNSHFTAAEQELILTTEVKTKTSVSNATLVTSNDKLFLLDSTEVISLFANDAARIAKLNGTATSWWLRNPYNNNAQGAAVYVTGSITYADITNSYGIRPALWVDLR